MKERIFGLKKSTVDELVMKVEQEYADKKKALELQLETLQEENSQFLKEIEDTPESFDDPSADIEFLELGKKRIQKIMQYLEESKQVEQNNLQSLHEESVREAKHELNQLAEGTEQAERKFKELLLQFKGMIDSGFVPESFGSQPSIMTPEPIFKKRKKSSFWDLEEEIDYFYDDTAFEEEEPLKEQSEKGKRKQTIPSVERTVPILPVPDIAPAAVTLEANYDDPLLEQIEAIKMQYITGKMAGEDLYDSLGNLIISRYSIITIDAVNKANKAGKLADLIVNMKLSGMEEDTIA